MNNNFVPDPSSPNPPQLPSRHINGTAYRVLLPSGVEPSTTTGASSSTVVNGGDDRAVEYYYEKLLRNEVIPNGDDQDYQFDRFPAGYRFCPKDHELILDYLMRKVLNLPMHRSKIVDINIYDYNPFDLVEIYKSYGDKEWYFFTPRDRKYPNGSRPNRRAGDGFWKATGADKTIKDKYGRGIGLRKALVFYLGRPPKGQKTNWIMHEYRVKNPLPSTRPSSSFNSMRLDDWVLCRIYEKISKNIRGRNRDSDGEDNNKELRQPEEDQTSCESQFVPTPVNSYICNDSPMAYHVNNNNSYFNPAPLNHQLMAMDTHLQFAAAPPPPYNCYPFMNNDGFNNFNGYQLQGQGTMPFPCGQPVAPVPAVPITARPPPTRPPPPQRTTSPQMDAPNTAAPPQETMFLDQIFLSEFFTENPDLFFPPTFHKNDTNL